MSGRTTVPSDRFNNWLKWRNSSLTVLVSPSCLPRFTSSHAPLSRAPRNRRIAKVVKPHYTGTADAHESLGLEPINYRRRSPSPSLPIYTSRCIRAHTARRKTETIARRRTMSVFSAVPRACSRVTAMYIGETRIPCESSETRTAERSGDGDGKVN